MKKLIIPVSLLFFITVCIVAGCYTTGIVQHLLVIVPMIVVLKVIGGKKEVKKTIKPGAAQKNTINMPAQLEIQFETKNRAHG